MNEMKNTNLVLHTNGEDYYLNEKVSYSNGGTSCFYVTQNKAIIVDDGICEGSEIFAYSNLTNKQNEYMFKYDKVYRVLKEDLDNIDEFISLHDEVEYAEYQADRSDFADASVLERKFEDLFADVYGKDSVKYLWKEYGITDGKGKTKFLDYCIETDNGLIAVEENGINYHHPQIIGSAKYKEQLNKQNLCTNRNIRLYRFSTEDCEFEERMEDDVRTFLGPNTSTFHERGLLVSRQVILYDHQIATLNDIQQKRLNGFKSFLIVFPTASGKSKIVEEDLKVFAKGEKDFHCLILVPNKAIKDDWENRIESHLRKIKDRILISSYSYMERHYQQYQNDYFNYIVVDEAHHAVAPGLKRTIQYFSPKFLIGLTATDQRPDKKKLETIFGTYHVGLSLQEAMEQRIIATANAFRIETNIDLSKVRINGKDYVNADLEKSIRVSSRNELIVDVINKYFTEGESRKRQGIIFCINTQHASEMERLLNESGIISHTYTNQTKNPKQIMEDFKNHKIRFLCTCQMISEGWDYPELGILVMARPTLSKVLYLQQLGRGLRKTALKNNVFVIDVVDEYGSMIQPCSLHSIFHNPYYVPFGEITKRDYHLGELITVDGIQERIERISEIDINSFDEKYGNYLSEEQLARDFYVSTGTISSWIKKGKIKPTISIPFGSRNLHMFSPEDKNKIRINMNIQEHNDQTIRKDFLDFIAERDYSLSYKMPFMLSFLNNLDASGDVNIDAVLDDYINFYKNRIQSGKIVDRKTCPFTLDILNDRKYVKRNMLTNPFEKFERKRFIYYSKDLSILSMNHALHSQLREEDIDNIKNQLKQDLIDYYENLERK